MADEWLPQTIIPGIAGLDLKRSLEQISVSKLSRMTNVVRTEEGSLTSRPGQTSVGTTEASEVHSLARLNRPSATGERIAGVGTNLYCGLTGAFSLIDSGYSGDPLTFVTAHPPISADSWLYIGDRTRMRKVRASDCLDLEVGLTNPPATDLDFPMEDFSWPTPTTWVPRDLARLCLFGFDIVGIGPGIPGDYTAYATTLKTTIDTCDSAGWTNNAGTGGAPTNAADAVDKKEGTASLKLTTNVGGAAGAYYNFWNKANALNLNSIGGSGTGATDDDIIHLWLRTDQPAKVSEIRIYFVVSSAFNTATIPGTSTANNTEAYVKSFRPSDFTSVRELSQTATGAAPTANTTTQNLQQLPRITDDRAGSVAITNQQTDASRIASSQISSGRGTWTEFGVVGLALHRRDFSRIGSDSSRTWGTVTGLVIAAQIIDTTSAINVWLDDIYLTGGYGLDSSLVGMQPYDYRHINYDTRTGAKSNPSPIQNIAFRLDSLRQGIIVTPAAYGDSSIHQRFFRRGGSLNNNWYFVGENTGDGVAFTDSFSDIQALASASVAGGLLELDNDKPVTTVSAAGATILAQPLPAIWGPINDIMLGCGDPYRAGDVYWSKPLSYDSWPAANHQEVCSPSEELMNGCVFSGQGYVFSRSAMYACYPNLQNAATITALPTSCTHGLISRYALCVGAGGIYFVSNDGLYVTVGGEEKSITDDDLRGLFNGETRNGYLPIDFTVPNAIRLQMHANELWFLYRDTGGVNQVLIYSIIFNYWRAYTFGQAISSILSEPGGVQSLIMGSRTAGTIFTHTGTSDAGVAISANIRTGALNQQLPRPNKRYGDIFFDASGATQINIKPYINTEGTALVSTAVTPSTIRNRFYVDLDDDLEARDISLDISWSTAAPAPSLFEVGVSYSPQPDLVQTRVTDWDTQGKFTDKYVKGIVLECDTFGQDKILNLQADGVTQATITVNNNGQKIVQRAFSQFQGRVLRVAPADSVNWQLYSFQWIFDNEPLSIPRWETQILNHGIPGQQVPTHGYFTVRNTAPITIQITTYRWDASTVVKTYTISTTGGKRIEFVPFEATAGVLFKYLFTSEADFWLYRGESSVFIVPWGGDGVERKPFGDDDTDETRGQVAPTAQRP